MTIYNTIAYKLLKVKIAVIRQVSVAIILKTVILSNLLRLGDDVCSTMFDIYAITERVVSIYVQISVTK